MLFRIVKYVVDDETRVPDRVSLVDAGTVAGAFLLARRVLGVESSAHVKLEQFIGPVPTGARVYNTKMTFEEMYGPGSDGLASSLQ
jgi:hypothetical protein